MAGVTIIVKVDDRKFVRFFRRFPGNLTQAGIDVSNELASSVQRRARYRAPVATGYLRDHILKRKTKEGFLVESLARYSGAIEFGFTPHWIPFDYILQHMHAPSVPGYETGFRIKPWIWTQPIAGNLGFMRLAAEGAQQDFIKIAERAISKAIAKSR